MVTCHQDCIKNLNYFCHEDTKAQSYTKNFLTFTRFHLFNPFNLSTFSPFPTFQPVSHSSSKDNTNIEAIASPMPIRII